MDSLINSNSFTEKLVILRSILLLWGLKMIKFTQKSDYFRQEN